MGTQSKPLYLFLHISLDSFWSWFLHRYNTQLWDVDGTTWTLFKL